MERDTSESISIDAGKAIPLVLFACVTGIVSGLGILFVSWKYQLVQLQMILLGFILYLVSILVIRVYETKKNIEVPPLKGWDQHSKDVDKVFEEFQIFLKHRLPGEKASINRYKHGAYESNRTMEAKYKENAFKINTGALDQVISFDKEKMLLHVEPGVSMDELALQSLAYGVVPQVVPEFPGITVGGAIGGAAGESTGHKYGVFHNTIEDMDIITGDGVLHKNVSRTNKSDLFMAVCCSYGTQGVLLRASVRVVKAPKYIRAHYYHDSSIQSALERLETLANASEPPEFLDAVAMSPSSVITIAGFPCEVKPPSASQLHLRNSRVDPWFFWYISDLAKEYHPSKDIVHIDYIEIDDYLFRFDRGAFWGARHGAMFLHGESFYKASKEEKTGPHIALRYLWGWLGTTRQIFKLSHAAGDVHIAESYLVQDLFMPTKEAAASLIEFNTDANYHIWPLWICPFRKVEENHEEDVGLGFPLTGKIGDIMYNVGIYGLVNHGNAMNPVAKNRDLEEKVKELGGKKIFYAQSFYTPEEFWTNFNKKNYDELRNRYKNSEIFHDITSKVLLSESTKQAICKNCGIDAWKYFHKLLPYFGQMIGELTLPRVIHPWIGIHNTEMKRYFKT